TVSGSDWVLSNPVVEYARLGELQRAPVPDWLDGLVQLDWRGDVRFADGEHAAISPAKGRLRSGDGIGAVRGHISGCHTPGDLLYRCVDHAPRDFIVSRLILSRRVAPSRGGPYDAVMRVAQRQEAAPCAFAGRLVYAFAQYRSAM